MPQPAPKLNVLFERHFTASMDCSSTKPFYDTKPAGALSSNIEVGEFNMVKAGNQEGVAEGAARYALIFPLTVTVKNEEGAEVMVLRLKQGLLFQVTDVEPKPADLEAFIANHLTPAAAVALADLSARTGYPPVMMPPLIVAPKQATTPPAATSSYKNFH